MSQIAQNHVLELSFTSISPKEAPDDLDFSILITTPSGKKITVPGYWAGGSTWHVRYASMETGTYTYSSACFEITDKGLHGQTGTFEVVTKTLGTDIPPNSLWEHGRLRVNATKKYLEHVDGTPFFWLGDTWWMGLTNRLHWPEEFALLTNDRTQKGFTLVQIVMGLYPDMPPFDDRGANEAGFPWQDKKFDRINPSYFDMADHRIQHLVEAGIVPCLVGFWGYFIGVMGVLAMKKHWRYLVARYGAYPVVWCIAGEAMMQYYLNHIDWKTWKKTESPRRLAIWSEVTGYVRSLDCFHNPITVHPTQYGHKQMDNPALLDVNMLQTGHANPVSEISVIKNTVKMIQTARKEMPNMPVVVGEVNYEGIFEANRQEIQRCLFWANLLSGGTGHTYGANGIWQLNRRDQSYGLSPHGASYGETPWEDAYQLLGSKHIALNKQLLCKYPWWKLEPHPEWVKRDLCYAAGIPGELRIVYCFIFGDITIRSLEKGKPYTAKWVDPKNGNSYPISQVVPDKKGNWRVPKPHIFQDWLLILESSQIS